MSLRMWIAKKVTKKSIMTEAAFLWDRADKPYCKLFATQPDCSDESVRSIYD